FSGDRGSVSMGAEYHKEDLVWAKDRWYTAEADPRDPGGNNSPVVQWGGYDSGLRTASSAVIWYVLNRGSNSLSADNFNPQNPDDTSNATTLMQLLTPLVRRSLFVNANYDTTDSIRFTSDLAYTNRSSNRQIAGYPTQSSAIGAPMAADSYFNPRSGTAVNW